jgi:hypothetical protein
MLFVFERLSDSFLQLCNVVFWVRDLYFLQGRSQQCGQGETA